MTQQSARTEETSIEAELDRLTYSTYLLTLIGAWRFRWCSPRLIGLWRGPSRTPNCSDAPSNFHCGSYSINPAWMVIVNTHRVGRCSMTILEWPIQSDSARRKRI